MVGLPVTLSCHVKGDPDHYWVGWMYRDSIIQEGEQYATSTARSTRGTHHYLTIHSVKQSGNYVCKVYTIHGTVDETTNNVTVENGMNMKYYLCRTCSYIYICIDATKPTPTSLMDVVYKLLFS